MLTKTKLALAATLILGSVSMAAAEDSSTSFAGINVYGPAAQQTLNSREVALPKGHVAAPVAHSNYFDRASQVTDGGGE